jgi:hypothetical protein
MASINKKSSGFAEARRLAIQRPAVNVMGVQAYASTDAERQLRRLVGACMLWEKQFKIDGKDIAAQIREQVAKVEPAAVAKIAIDAREINKLRHVPLLIVREMARLPRHRAYVAETLARVIQRPDEITEFLAIYWMPDEPMRTANNNLYLGMVRNGRSFGPFHAPVIRKKTPLSAQVKKGLAAAFLKFNEYSFAKYDRDGEIKLRDVLFLVHAKPQTPEQAALFSKIASRTLATPNTWEVRLSSGENKKDVFVDLIVTKQLGGLALLKNLRNMKEAGVEPFLIRQAILSIDTTRILPFRFIAAARFAPEYEAELEEALFRSISAQERFKGHTVALIDHSGSMRQKISEKSDMSRFDAACGVAMVLRERCDSVSVYSFSDNLVRVPNRRGFALRDALANAQRWGLTQLGQAVNQINRTERYDRILIFTDEQQTDKVQARPLPGSLGYVVNVTSHANGLSYADWLKVDGFSESVINFISDFEGNQFSLPFKESQSY